MWGPFQHRRYLLPRNAAQLEQKARYERWAARIGVLLVLVGGTLAGVAHHVAPLPLMWLIVPLVLMTLWAIGQRLFLGEALHNVLLGLGILWFMVGVLLLLLVFW